MFLSNGSLVTKTPVSLTSSSWFPSMPPMSGAWPSAYSAIYRQQLWVYVVVNKLAAGTARLPLPVYKRDDLNRPKADAHPMAKLLAAPNPGMSSFDLWFWTSSTFDVFGEAFWLKQREGGRVVGLYPLHPASMEWSEEKRSWRFDNGSLIIGSIDDGDLVHFRHYNPDSQTRGMSPLEPLRLTLENEWHARNATSSFWKNGARPGVALSHPSSISEDAAKRLRAQWDSVAGGSGKTGSTVILEEGMKPEVLTLSAEEAQYIETRKLNREEVCGAYDVPPPAVHILDHATFSNITEQMRSVYRDTQAPRLRRFEATLELDLRRAEWPNDEVYAEFLMDEVLRGDFETRQDALAKASHMTIAEKRRIENLPFIDGTDRIFLNTATMPLDAIDAQSAAIVAQTEQSADPLAEVIPLAVARSVMGRLSWQNSLDDVDARSLTDGLSEADTRAVAGALSAEHAKGGSVSDLRDRVRSMGVNQVKATKFKAPVLTSHRGQIAKTLASFFARQGEEVMGAGNFDTDRWNKELTTDLHGTAVIVSSMIGKAAMRDLGFDSGVYDVDRTVEFLRAVSARLAGNINETTARQYESATSDPEGNPSDVFVESEARAQGISTGVGTLLAGFALVEAGRRVAEAEGVEPTKTWITGPNPRSSHAAMNGQTVGIDDVFSNGQDWPGSGGGVDEVAGCNCTVSIEF